MRVFGFNPLKMIRCARLMCAGMLLLAFVSTSVPLITSAAPSSTACARSCCAGKAPHAAGSCEHGSCHAALPARRKSSNHRQRVSQPIEQLCGVPRGLETKSLAKGYSSSGISREKNGALPNGRASDTNKPSDTKRLTDTNQLKLSPASVTMPCQPECGGFLAGFSSSRQQNTATIGHGPRLRPAAQVLLARRDDLSPKSLDALSEHRAPRGPPLSLS